MSRVVQIPVQLDITVTCSPNGVLEAAADAERSRPRQPIIDTNYATRTGFATNFIGVNTPLPTVRNPAVLATRLDGQGALLPYEHFTVVMHAGRRLALFTASNVDYSPAAKRPEAGRDYTRRGLNGFGSNDGGEIWLLDSRIAAHHQVENVFYDRDRGAFQKGHVVRREDVCFGTNYAQVRRANGDTFHSTNCTPQRPNFNDSGAHGIWGELENFISGQAASERLSLIAGPVLAESDPTFDGVGNSGPLPLQIPQKFWKVVCAKKDGRLQVFAFVLEQRLSGIGVHEFSVSPQWVSKQVTVAALESLVGHLTFDPVYHAADQAAGGHDGGGHGTSPFRGRSTGSTLVGGGGAGRLVSVSNHPKSGRVETVGHHISLPRLLAGRPGRFGQAEATRPTPTQLVIGKAPVRAVEAAGAVYETVIGPDDRVRVTATQASPWRMICSLEMTSPNGVFIGTGWLVGRKTVVTAGHCVFDNNPSGMGGWATSIVVSPGRDGSVFPFGRFTATRFRSNSLWVQTQEADYDYGCIQLDEPLADDLGSFDIGSPSADELAGYLVNIAGYPGDRGDGTELYNHRNQIVRVTDRRLFYTVDTFGGQSGSPAIVYESAGSPPLVVGIHAYGTGGTPASFGITANSAPRITPAVGDLIRGWVDENP